MEILLYIKRHLGYAYENQYGPLTNFGYAPSRSPWQWNDEPWPWEKEFND
ncbi:spore coat protein CotJB [Metaclostridioides mangenotii]|uniref:Protein CotJB domain-containing protein n=1 Tax=Metaclostridioides mangenotii TaxID=1540 RepID=A0ABS4E6V8_9FIRM|nr:spore coat protein CotJB [Clostridioides mangenotii]MBP1853679.1 hypothetical protein [Clostridioides mangenotii]